MAGKPFVVFPAQGGRFYEYEDFGMVEACRPSIDAGRITLVTVDSVDNQSWCNWNLHPADRGRRHNDYDRYVIDEVIPFIRSRGWAGEMGTTGCSMGGYHAANFFFRHPDVFDTMICLSGLLAAAHVRRRRCRRHGLLQHAPLLPARSLRPLVHRPLSPQPDHRLRGPGPVGRRHAGRCPRRSKRSWRAKDVPAWIDVWGHDVSHDWPWWRRQMPYFLHHLGL